MADPILIEVFLSSPGDVNPERGKVRAVAEEINHDPMYKDKVKLEVIAWDDPHSDVVMPVTLTPQQAIDLGMKRPSECQVCITLFWARMGTPLDTDVHKTKPDGTPYWSGTEWEYLDAVRGAKENGTGLPVVYLYRRTDEPPQPSPRPDQDIADAYIEYGTQRKRVQAFFAQLRDPASGAMRGYYHEYAGLDAFAEMMEKHLRTLANHIYQKKTDGAPEPSDPVKAVAVPLRWNISSEGSPFPGLNAFTERYEPVYFGRSREVNELIRRLTTQRLLVIVGASGSGKSSLVRAGLFPKLRDNAIPPSARWFRVTMRPTTKPFLALAEALITQVSVLVGDPDTSLVERCQTLAEVLRENPSALSQQLASAFAGDPHQELVLFVDQFEELFTLANEMDCSAFLLMLKQPTDRLRIILTIRSDFYDTLLPHLEEELREATYTLAKPSSFALLEMIRRPAEVAGLSFDDDLPETILNDTGDGAGALALMAYALDELYHTSYTDKRLTFAAYEAIGGVEGAIGKRAETAFAEIDLPDRDRLFERVFRELVTVDERGTATRQRASLGKFDQQELSMIRTFADTRLLVTQDDFAEVAHEAIFRSWTRLKEWIAEAQEDLILLRQVRNAAHDWHAKGRPDFLLWPQERLVLVYAMKERLKPELNKFEEDFTEPEQTRLLREIVLITTDHKRRRWIGERLADIGDPRSGIGLDEHGLPQIEWLPVRGSGDPIIIKTDEREIGPVLIPDFYVAKYLITYVQFQAFLDATDGFHDGRWWEDMPDQYKRQTMSAAVAQYANYPRDNVAWYQSVAFSRWLDAKCREFGLFARFSEGEWMVRLPTEWEWQWMAQAGKAELKYPWGDWDEHPRANTTEAGIGDRTTAVGMYPHGAANCDALDVAGNLYEWCLNDHENPEITDGYGNDKRKVLRGGSFNFFRDYAAASYRHFNDPRSRYSGYGLRLAVCPIDAL